MTTATAPSTTAKAPSVEESGLAAVAKANQAGGTTVATLWGLTATSSESEMPETEDIINLPYVVYRTESVVGAVDSRKLVPKEHFGPGGKYRAIVKLFLRFENSVNPGSWAIATGWLIRNDLLVTAGHCAFDWGYKQGRLVEAKAYIGYHGKENIKDPNVQFRRGKRITTTSGWMTSGSYRAGDIALIQVDAPFENVTPINYADTPAKGLAPLGVVGYPGDLKDEKTGEAGANMYEAYETTQWSLATNEWKMLEYKIDTYGGNSGSPVFRQRDMKSVGVHTYGGLVNSATVLGEFGNVLDPYINALSSKPADEAIDETGVEALSFSSWLTRMYKPWKPHNPFSYLPGGKTTETSIDNPPEASSEESFFKILKKAFQLVTETGATTEADASISLGEFGHIIGPMASIALQSGTAAKDGAGAPSRAAVIHRAVLGEAALAAIVKMSPEAKAEFAILDKMVKIVKDAGPFVKKAWSVFGTVASSPIIRLLVDAANKPKGHKESLSDPGISSEIATLASEDQSTETAQDWEAADPGYKNLMEALVAAATEDGQPTDTEAWWGSIAKLVVGGAVSAVGGWVGKKFGGKGETDFDNGETAAPAIPALGDAPLRALIGEAALQALTTVPKEVLQKEHVSESMWSVFKDVLPSVIRLGSDVAASIAKGKKENFQVPLPTPYKKPVSDDPQPREGHECDDLPGLSKKPVNGDSQPPPDFEGPLPAPYKKPVSGDSQTAQRFRTLPFEPQKPTHNSPGPFPSQWGDKLKNAAPLAYSSAVQA